MTKEKYMALADLQTLWTNKMKPIIPKSLVDLEYTAANNRKFSIKDTGVSQPGVDLGWDWSNGDGPGIAFKSVDNYDGPIDDSSSGGLFLWTRGKLSPSATSVTTKHLRMKPSGLFKFDDKNIITQESKYTGATSALNTGTDTTALLWSAKGIADFVNGKVTVASVATCQSIIDELS